MDNHNKKRLLQKSADMEYFITSLKIGIGAFLFGMAFVACLCFIMLYQLSDMRYLFYIAIILFLILCLPFFAYILYFMIRIWLLLKNLDGYILLEVDLDNIQRETWITNNYYFEFVLENSNGELKRCKTKAIFSLSKFMKPQLNNYINTHALIAYDENKARVVLLKPLFVIKK